MSIVDEGSVLIVGAGASVDFWMPLGGDLIEQVRERIETDFPLSAKLRGRELGFEFGELVNNTASASLTPEGFLLRPLKVALATKHCHFEGQERREAISGDIKRLFQLSDRLNKQTAETIDAFIAENPSLADVTKMAVGAVMVQAAYTRKGHVALLRPLAARRVNDDARNWIHLLINICRHGLPRERHISRKVQIINFNYDPFLEHVLREQWNNTEAQLWEWDTVFKVEHPHGRFPDFPESVPDNDLAQLALHCGEAISVVNEKDPPLAVQRAREQVAQWILEAGRIYAVGFAFARPNCELLGLHRLRDFKAPNERGQTTIVFANYNGDVGVKLATERYAAGVLGTHKRAVRVEEVPGTSARPLTVSDFIKAGYLGDLPG